MIKRCIVATAIILLVFSLFQVQASNQIYHFQDKKKEVQFKHLLKEMRCLVCQNQDLSDSASGLAEDLRARVYNMVQEGNSDGEIIQYFTKRYGDFILFKPPVKWITLFLWLSPFIFIVLGLSFFARRFMFGKST